MTHDHAHNAPKRPRNIPNTPEDHFTSPIAHHIEESIVHLHTITHNYSDDLPDPDLQALHRIKKGLAIIYKRHVSAYTKQ